MEVPIIGPDLPFFPMQTARLVPPFVPPVAAFLFPCRHSKQSCAGRCVHAERACPFRRTARISDPSSRAPFPLFPDLWPRLLHRAHLVRAQMLEIDFRGLHAAVAHVLLERINAAAAFEVI